MRAELKANFLIRNTGDIRNINLAPGQRYLIYRAHMRVLEDLPARAFAVVFDKRRHPGWAPRAVFDTCWETLLQRLAVTSRKENVTFVVSHDEGENDAVRRWVRRSRRYLTAGSAFGPGRLVNPAPLLVDDPIPQKIASIVFRTDGGSSCIRRVQGCRPARPTYQQDLPGQHVG